jgi:hypothetical protein
MGLFYRTRESRQNQSLDIRGLGLFHCSLLVETDLAVILLRLTWTTVRDLLAEVAHELETLIQFLTTNDARGLVTGSDIREALIIRIVFCRRVDRSIRVPLVDIHGYEVARAQIEAHAEPWK